MKESGDGSLTQAEGDVDLKINVFGALTRISQSPRVGPNAVFDPSYLDHPCLSKGWNKFAVGLLVISGCLLRNFACAFAVY
jgi:hypothetical protein